MPVLHFSLAAIGLTPTTTLIVSQVVLSVVLPLSGMTHCRNLIGFLMSKAITIGVVIAWSVVMHSLNVWQLYSTFAPS